MFKKIASLSIMMASAAFMFLANIAVSTNTILLWHDIECPKELLKK